MNTFKKFSILAAAVTAALTLSGCSALNIGAEQFSCDGMPGSVYCHSARDVYEMTNDGVVPVAVKKDEGAYNEECDDCVRAEDVNPDLRRKMGKSVDGETSYAVGEDGEELTVVQRQATGSGSGTRDEIIANYVAPALPDHPVPIRTPAQVMRIWIAPYVDTTGDLMAPGYVYTEIEPRRWIYPDKEVGNMQTNSLFNPLKAAPKTGGRYQTPDTYSQPQKGEMRERGSFNSLEKFRKSKDEAVSAMKR